MTYVLPLLSRTSSTEYPGGTASLLSERLSNGWMECVKALLSMIWYALHLDIHLRLLALNSTGASFFIVRVICAVVGRSSSLSKVLHIRMLHVANLGSVFVVFHFH